MHYDPIRQRIVLAFGLVSLRNSAETWEYGGLTWTQVWRPPVPFARRGFDFSVWDGVRQRAALFGGRTDQGINGETWEYGATPRLTASPSTLSIGTGRRHTLSLQAGAFRTYLVLGSLSGTSAGYGQPPGLWIPLNLDAYTNLTIELAGGAVFPGTLGTPNGAGTATAALMLPAGLAAAAGLTLHHAYLTFDRSGAITSVSNATGLRLTP